MVYRLKRITPYFFITIIAILILLPQLINHVPLVGVDSVFHMNRFYDTAMQIKTGHFNYFQSFFGFHQSGRIINALYGPFFAYLNGFLLLIAKNWFNYQVLSSFLVLIVSGMLMNYLLIKNNVQKKYSVLVAVLYMFSTPITNWVVGQQFTGWGAALMPMLLLSGTQMIKDKDVHVIPLVIGMTILLETHVLSSLVGAIGLIPFFIMGFIQSKRRFQMFKHAIVATIITVLLTFNVWGGSLDIFGSNHLIPVAPQTDLDQDALSIFNQADTKLNPIFSIIFLLTLILLIIYWKKINSDIKIFVGIGYFFLWISSHFFPWTTLNHLIPNLSYYLQMPKRFDVIAFILILLALGKIMTNQSIFNFQTIQLIFLISCICLLGFQLHSSIEKGIHRWNTNQVVYNSYNDHFHIHNSEKLRNSFMSHDLSKSIKYISKATPDYLPIQKDLPPNQYYNFHPYGNYDDQIVYYQKHYSLPVKKWVSNNNFKLSWHNNSSRNVQTQLPIIKYGHTMVRLNGKLLHHVKTSNIGVVVVNAKSGYNYIKVSYQPARSFYFGIIISILTWLLLIFYCIKNGVKNRFIK